MRGRLQCVLLLSQYVFCSKLGAPSRAALRFVARSSYHWRSSERGGRERMAARWRTAWITGASSGIGRALAVALTRQGVKVAASARSADTLAELARTHPGIA